MFIQISIPLTQIFILHWSFLSLWIKKRLHTDIVHWWSPFYKQKSFSTKSFFEIVVFSFTTLSIRQGYRLDISTCLSNSGGHLDDNRERMFPVLAWHSWFLPGVSQSFVLLWSKTQTFLGGYGLLLRLLILTDIHTGIVYSHSYVHVESQKPFHIFVLIQVFPNRLHHVDQAFHRVNL
jgi:hypothetical protein